PEITMLDSHSIAVHITASLTLFKGPLALSRRIKSALQQTFPAVAMGMAPTAWGAYLLARQVNCTGRVARAISQTSMVRHLNRLPIQALPAAQPHLFWLAQLGCSTLAEVMQLPRASLLVRTSSQFVDQLDFAYGYRTPVFS